MLNTCGHPKARPSACVQPCGHWFNRFRLIVFISSSLKPDVTCEEVPSVTSSGTISYVLSSGDEAFILKQPLSVFPVSCCFYPDPWWFRLWMLYLMSFLCRQCKLCSLRDEHRAGFFSSELNPRCFPPSGWKFSALCFLNCGFPSWRGRRLFYFWKVCASERK